MHAIDEKGDATERAGTTVLQRRRRDRLNEVNRPSIDIRAFYPLPPTTSVYTIQDINLTNTLSASLLVITV